MIAMDPVQQESRSHGSRWPTACGHSRHVGTCPECQRVQLARWRAQLLAVDVRSTRSSSSGARQALA